MPDRVTLAGLGCGAAPFANSANSAAVSGGMFSWPTYVSWVTLFLLPFGLPLAAGCVGWRTGGIRAERSAAAPP